MTASVYRPVYRLGYTDEFGSVHRSYERTDERTDVDRWLSSRDHLTLRNAREQKQEFPSGRFGDTP